MALRLRGLGGYPVEVSECFEPEARFLDFIPCSPLLLSRYLVLLSVVDKLPKLRVARRHEVLVVPEDEREELLVEELGGRAVEAVAEVRAVEQATANVEAQGRLSQLRAELGDPEVVLLGVDRLDYTKGIRHRLKAFGELLADGRVTPPETTMVQIASPSRERVDQYRLLRDEIEVTVGRINGDYGVLGRPAIHYMHHSYPAEEMAAMYLAADVMLVTSLRDGMNLVAKEYIAARRDLGGVLVLSEFTGAADELTQALLINPHDTDGTKAAIMRAITMEPREARRRMRALRRRVLEYDVNRWADEFLRALSSKESS